MRSTGLVTLALVALTVAACSSAPSQPKAAAPVSSTPAASPTASPSPRPTIPDTHANQAACNEFAKEQRGQITLQRFEDRLEPYGNQLSYPLVIALAGFYDNQLNVEDHLGFPGLTKAKAQQEAHIIRELCASIGITV